MNKIEIFKNVAKTASAIGASIIMGNLVGATTPNDTKKLTKVFIGIGSFVLGSMAGDVVSKYVDTQIDDALEGTKGTYSEPQ